MNANNFWSNAAEIVPDQELQVAWLLATSALSQGDCATARKAVMDNPGLKNSILGREVLAQIMLTEGNEEAAVKMYSDIESRSATAKMFLARRAIAEQNWNEARRLTELLLLQYPDAELLKAQLRTVLHAKQKFNASRD